MRLWRQIRVPLRGGWSPFHVVGQLRLPRAHGDHADHDEQHEQELRSRRALLFAGVLSQLLRQSALDERATAPQFLLVLLVVISVIAMGAWQSQLPDYVKWRPAAAQWDTDLPP